MTLRFVCINAGDYLGRGIEYTNILFDSVRRNLRGGMEGEFWCFTDDYADKRKCVEYHPDIHVFPLPGLELKGWFNKLALFRPGLFDPGDRIVYLDLDTLICGPIEWLAEYDGPFAACGDFFYPGQLQSAVMTWFAGFGEEIWNEYVWAERPEVLGGDQVWIQQVLERRGYEYRVLQDLFPGMFVSYKASGGRIPETAHVVCFHGHPRPHEVLTGWVPEVWKIGGLTRAHLDTMCNTAREKLLSNVTENLNMGFPQLQAEIIHDGHAVIVGGGPSINQKADEIRWRKSLGQTVFALNGAMRWCGTMSIDVDYQVIVDAKPDSLAFLTNLDDRRTFLIASQVDPMLLWSLDKIGVRDVVLWHSDAPGVEAVLPEGAMRIGGGSTVGLSAMVLAAVLGFRFIHLYGYDSSLAGDDHHAYPQPQNADDLIVDVLEDDGTRWRAAPWMVQQAQEFPGLCQDLMEHYGVEVITVAGEGLLPHIARKMPTGEVAADVRAREILNRLPDRAIIGVEVGVFAGDLSERLLQRRDNLCLIMVDSWAADGADMVNKHDFHAKLSQEQQDNYHRMAAERVAFAGNRAHIMQRSSIEAAGFFVNEVLDFVFIDADHAEKSVKADIWAWHQKVKPGGLLCGHDYGNELPGFGVTSAVDEFVNNNPQFKLERGDNFTWFIRIPEAARIAAE